MQVSKSKPLKIISFAYLNHSHTTWQVSVSLSLAIKSSNRQDRLLLTAYRDVSDICLIFTYQLQA